MLLLSCGNGCGPRRGRNARGQRRGSIWTGPPHCRRGGKFRDCRHTKIKPRALTGKAYKMRLEKLGDRIGGVKNPEPLRPILKSQWIITVPSLVTLSISGAWRR